MTLANKPAFPAHTACNVQGMTLREYYAGQVVAGNNDEITDYDRFAHYCVNIADALIAELEKSDAKE